MGDYGRRAWKRSGAGYEAGCRVAPDELRRSLARFADRTGANLVLLLRGGDDGGRFTRIAGVDYGASESHASGVDPGTAAEALAATATHFALSHTNGVDALTPDARMLVHWLDRPAHGGFALVLARHPDRPAFDARALAAVTAGCDWLEDVIDLWWSGKRSAARAAALRAALGNGENGVILLDRCGSIIETNAAAARALREGGGLALRDGLLGAEHPADDVRLRDAIVEVITAAASGRTITPMQFTVGRGTGQLPLVIAVMRPFDLPAVHSDAADPVVLLQIVDPDARQARVAAACALYGLTRTETRLTERLIADATLAEAAATLNLSLHTARTYLKRIFAKTGVCRQASLVRLVLNSQPPLRGGLRGAVPHGLVASAVPIVLEQRAMAEAPGRAGTMGLDDPQLEMRLSEPAPARRLLHLATAR